MSGFRVSGAGHCGFDELEKCAKTLSVFDSENAKITFGFPGAISMLKEDSQYGIRPVR